MAKVSEILNKSIDDFLALAPGMTEHMQNKENPHGVTKSQVGLSNVDNVKQATKAEFDNHVAAAATKAELAAHAGNKSNPHEVTKSQVGLSNVDNAKQATKTEFDGLSGEVVVHKSNKSNPHMVTKAQVGLSSVDNTRQAAKADFDRHTSGQGLRHTADDVDFAAGKTVRQKIDELIVDGGGGTMNHDELQNRAAPGQHPIGAISGLERFIAPEVIEFTGSTTNDVETELFAQTPSPRVNANGRVTFTPGDACAFKLNMTGAVLNTDGYIGYCECFEIRGTFFYLGQVAVPALVTGTESAHNNAVGEGHLFKVNITMEGAAKDGIKILVTGNSSKDRALWHGTLTLTNLHNFAGEV